VRLIASPYGSSMGHVPLGWLTTYYGVLAHLWRIVWQYSYSYTTSRSATWGSKRPLLRRVLDRGRAAATAAAPPPPPPTVGLLRGLVCEDNRDMRIFRL
jgi:hypothetical protein